MGKGEVQGGGGKLPMEGVKRPFELANEGREPLGGQPEGGHGAYAAKGVGGCSGWPRRG